MNNIVEMKVEIQKNSRIKYEYNRATGNIEVDRILRGDFVYPCVYGFVPQALDWDGDELDVLLFSEEQFIPGVTLKARIIGAMKMIDSGETDTKLIAVHADDYRLEKITKLEELPKEWLENVDHFFSHYKDWKKPGLTKVEGFENIEWAIQELHECTELMEKFGKLPKEKFLEKMKKEHPDKYETK